MMAQTTWTAKTVKYKVGTIVGRCVPSRAAIRDESLNRTGAQKLIAACQTIPAIRALALDLLYSQVMKTELAIVPNVYKTMKNIPISAAMAPTTP